MTRFLLILGIAVLTLKFVNAQKNKPAATNGSVNINIPISNACLGILLI